MPVPKGQQILRKRVEIGLDEIQSTVDRLEKEQQFKNRTQLFEAVAAALNGAHPELEGVVTHTVIRLRFDPSRTPGTTLHCTTAPRIKKK